MESDPNEGKGGEKGTNGAAAPWRKISASLKMGLLSYCTTDYSTYLQATPWTMAQVEHFAPYRFIPSDKIALLRPYLFVLCRVFPSIISPLPCRRASSLGRHSHRLHFDHIIVRRTKYVLQSKWRRAEEYFLPTVLRTIRKYSGTCGCGMYPTIKASPSKFNAARPRNMSDIPHSIVGCVSKPVDCTSQTVD